MSSINGRPPALVSLVFEKAKDREEYLRMASGPKRTLEETVALSRTVKNFDFMEMPGVISHREWRTFVGEFQRLQAIVGPKLEVHLAESVAKTKVLYDFERSTGVGPKEAGKFPFVFETTRAKSQFLQEVTAKTRTSKGAALLVEFAKRMDLEPGIISDAAVRSLTELMDRFLSHPAHSSFVDGFGTSSLQVWLANNRRSFQVSQAVARTASVQNRR